MLFIVDMQKNFLSEKTGDSYIPGAEKLVPGIIEKIKEYQAIDDCILYTLDIYAEKEVHLTNYNNLENVITKEKKATEKEKYNAELCDDLKPHLKGYPCIKKSHYCIPPEELSCLQQRFKQEEKIINEIEILGVETHICVLSNAIAIRSAFPDAKIKINKNLTKSKDEKKHERALKIMRDLGMEIVG